MKHLEILQASSRRISYMEPRAASYFNPTILCSFKLWSGAPNLNACSYCIPPFLYLIVMASKQNNWTRLTETQIKAILQIPKKLLLPFKSLHLQMDKKVTKVCFPVFTSFHKHNSLGLSNCFLAFLPATTHFCLLPLSIKTATTDQ